MQCSGEMGRTMTENLSPVARLPCLDFTKSVVSKDDVYVTCMALMRSAEILCSVLCRSRGCGRCVDLNAASGEI